MSETMLSKAERRRALIENIVAGQQPEPSSARAELERRLGPDGLARLDEHMLTLLTAEQGDPELDEPAFFDALGVAKAERQQALAAALTGRRPASSVVRPSTEAVSFDGGVRKSPTIPVSHETTLLAILDEARSRGSSGF